MSGYFGDEPTCRRCDYPRRLHHLLGVAHDYTPREQEGPGAAATATEASENHPNTQEEEELMTDPTRATVWNRAADAPDHPDHSVIADLTFGPDRADLPAWAHPDTGDEFLWEMDRRGQNIESLTRSVPTERYNAPSVTRPATVDVHLRMPWAAMVPHLVIALTRAGTGTNNKRIAFTRELLTLYPHEARQLAQVLNDAADLANEPEAVSRPAEELVPTHAAHIDGHAHLVTVTEPGIWEYGTDLGDGIDAGIETDRRIQAAGYTRTGCWQTITQHDGLEYQLAPIKAVGQ